MPLSKINNEEKLYVIEHGKYFTTLGFDYAVEQCRKVAFWLNRPDLVPMNMQYGTKSGYLLYERAMLAGNEYHKQTGQQCDANIHKCLRSYYRQRVEVEYTDGEKERFYVGRSTGWLPVLLRILKKNSSSGDAISSHEQFTRVTPLDLYL